MARAEKAESAMGDTVVRLAKAEAAAGDADARAREAEEQLEKLRATQKGTAAENKAAEGEL